MEKRLSFQNRTIRKNKYSHSKKIISAILYFIILIVFSLSATAWEDHPGLTYTALDGNKLSEVMTQVVLLEKFLRENEKDLSLFLDKLEAFLTEKIENYPSLPEKLRFSANKEENIIIRFFNAIRINPEFKINYFFKSEPGISYDEKREINFHDIAYIYYKYPYSHFYEIIDGESVSALKVLSSGSDEPDYGIDIGLFENNDTYYGAVYGFGEQPFGNPSVSYGSQAPFHMGFYNEAGIVYGVAPDMKRCFPEMRAIMFAELAKFAFEKGCSYWGYRFTGWGLHYIQDMTMPYHSSIMPGNSGLYLVWVGLLDAIGIKGPYNRVLTDVTNKHFLLEMIQLERINSLASSGESANPIIQSLKLTESDELVFKYDNIKTIISKNAKDMGKKIKKALEKLIKDKAKYTQIQQIYETDNYNIYEIAYEPGTKQFNEFIKVFTDIMKQVGIHTRSFVNYCLPENNN